MIERLLPATVVSAEAFGDVAGERCFPGEEHLVAQAVPERRREFVTARRCARQALRELGFPPAAILPGPRRAPRWPPGVVGSITHCRGYRAAAVARTAHAAGLGIDAEPHRPLPAGVVETISTAGEPKMLRRLRDVDLATHWDRLLFSAKESIYKAWYPLTGRELGFEEARLSIEPVTRTFTGQLVVTTGVPGPRVVHGRYLVGDGLVVTAVLVPSGHGKKTRPGR
ncbi:4'-phosphopantetheinyl transferase family protein [Plantactinospora endophytica]|uniref:4'-phosphopantetheinyl transferase family protein n=1 Tax=Plantactinospora endophytica TaxID=673535 RepID=UPI001943A3C7|nr:4'-phosphopantetheinyl transferase superfamily protein [Plantactinospora endophytica]